MHRHGLVCLALLLAPTAALAHAIHAECWVSGDNAEVRATFEDGTKPAKAKVRVVDEQGHELAAGVTDEKGLYQFAKPTPGTYRVIVDAGAGHRTETTMTIGDPKIIGLVSPGPTEEEFTRFKWLQVLIGLGAIVGFCMVLWLVQRTRKQPEAPAA
jgi:hypothetical protein